MPQNDPRERFRGSQENSLYQEIRTELDQGMPREASYDSRKSEKAVRKGTEEGEAEGRCYRLPRRINWL